MIATYRASPFNVIICRAAAQNDTGNAIAQSYSGDRTLLGTSEHQRIRFGDGSLSCCGAELIVGDSDVINASGESGGVLLPVKRVNVPIKCKGRYAGDGQFDGTIVRRVAGDILRGDRDIGQIVDNNVERNFCRTSAIIIKNE